MWCTRRESDSNKKGVVSSSRFSFCNKNNEEFDSIMNKKLLARADKALAVSYLHLPPSMTNEGFDVVVRGQNQMIFFLAFLNKLFTSGWCDPCGLTRSYKSHYFKSLWCQQKKSNFNVKQAFLRRVWCWNFLIKSFVYLLLLSWKKLIK